jgi:hypothetical protein
VPVSLNLNRSEKLLLAAIALILPCT